ncbi:MAG TPA: nucleoside 2-deoxyribosyltransferase [Candidatus Pristimantibacillus sp.]|nr:nucleoside 2-deoxyribosyltransferase [Candidatus Pristimantibacillus sp.]
MKIFVCASYSSKVNYNTGEVFPEYKAWLEGILAALEQHGHNIFCALRADQYKINEADPADAFSLDMRHIAESDCLLALVSDQASWGVQTEIGVGVATHKKVVLAYAPEHKLSYFNAAMVKAGVVDAIELPLTEENLQIFNQ